MSGWQDVALRLTAVPAVAAAAEALLEVVRDAPGVATALVGAPDRDEAAARWREFDARFAEVRRAFVDAGRSTDIKPSEDL